MDSTISHRLVPITIHQNVHLPLSPDITPWFLHLAHLGTRGFITNLLPSSTFLLLLSLLFTLADLEPLVRNISLTCLTDCLPLMITRFNSKVPGKYPPLTLLVGNNCTKESISEFCQWTIADGGGVWAWKWERDFHACHDSNQSERGLIKSLRRSYLFVHNSPSRLNTISWLVILYSATIVSVDSKRFRYLFSPTRQSTADESFLSCVDLFIISVKCCTLAI